MCCTNSVWFRVCFEAPILETVRSTHAGPVQQTNIKPVPFQGTINLARRHAGWQSSCATRPTTRGAQRSRCSRLRRRRQTRSAAAPSPLGSSPVCARPHSRTQQLRRGPQLPAMPPAGTCAWRTSHAGPWRRCRRGWMRTSRRPAGRSVMSQTVTGLPQWRRWLCQSFERLPMRLTSCTSS